MLSSSQSIPFSFPLDAMVIKIKLWCDRIKNYCNLNISLPYIFFSFNWVYWISNCYFVGQSIVIPFLINKVEVEIEEILLK